jgi:hypothetical protein
MDRREDEQRRLRTEGDAQMVVDDDNEYEEVEEADDDVDDMFALIDTDRSKKLVKKKVTVGIVYILTDVPALMLSVEAGGCTSSHTNNIGFGCRCRGLLYRHLGRASRRWQVSSFLRPGQGHVCHRRSCTSVARRCRRSRQRGCNQDHPQPRDDVSPSSLLNVHR